MKDMTSKEKREEVQKVEALKEKFKQERRIQYRYYCDACSNIAAYGVEPTELNPLVCRTCGKSLTYKSENWIKMNKWEVVK